ncbi:hypothetical protein C8R44DRAFT_741931 [Mycena epipterygia]|nr:hypothetical protein C8R44DRAFT_741931 [Mycena epipterygia]
MSGMDSKSRSTRLLQILSQIPEEICSASHVVECKRVISNSDALGEELAAVVHTFWTDDAVKAASQLDNPRFISSTRPIASQHPALESAFTTATRRIIRENWHPDVLAGLRQTKPVHATQMAPLLCRLPSQIFVLNLEEYDRPDVIREAVDLFAWACYQSSSHTVVPFRTVIVSAHRTVYPQLLDLADADACRPTAANAGMDLHLTARECLTTVISLPARMAFKVYLKDELNNFFDTDDTAILTQRRRLWQNIATPPHTHLSVFLIPRFTYSTSSFDSRPPPPTLILPPTLAVLHVPFGLHHGTRLRAAQSDPRLAHHRAAGLGINPQAPRFSIVDDLQTHATLFLDLMQLNKLQMPCEFGGAMFMGGGTLCPACTRLIVRATQKRQLILTTVKHANADHRASQGTVRRSNYMAPQFQLPKVTRELSASDSGANKKQALNSLTKTGLSLGTSATGRTDLAIDAPQRSRKAVTP